MCGARNVQNTCELFAEVSSPQQTISSYVLESQSSYMGSQLLGGQRSSHHRRSRVNGMWVCVRLRRLC